MFKNKKIFCGANTIPRIVYSYSDIIYGTMLTMLSEKKWVQNCMCAYISGLLHKTNITKMLTTVSRWRNCAFFVCFIGLFSKFSIMNLYFSCYS